MDFKKHLENAWRLTINHLTSLVILTSVLSISLILIPLLFVFLSLPIFSVLAMCILGSVMLPGYIYSILLLIRENRQPRIEDLFSQRQLMLPLSIFSGVVAIVTTVGFFFLYFPGIAVLCVVVFACLYVVPLMIEQKMGIVEAIKISWYMAVKDNVADHWVIVILVIGLTTIGSSVFLGVLFTQPFATVFTLLVFIEKSEKNFEGVDRVNAVKQAKE